jgi:hypothetical protein
MPLPPKSTSVSPTGEPDTWTPPRSFRSQAAPDGSTRLVVSVPSEELAEVHRRLLRVLGDRVGVLYVQLTDRAVGQLSRPVKRVALEVPIDRLLAVLDARAPLIWHDGRHQLWCRGPMEDQVVLDELGVLYTYPDDPAFRDVLAEIPELPTVGMDGRDYVRVNFEASADEMERTLWEELAMREWA